MQKGFPRTKSHPQEEEQRRLALPYLRQVTQSPKVMTIFVLIINLGLNMSQQKRCDPAGKLSSLKCVQLWLKIPLTYQKGENVTRSSTDTYGPQWLQRENKSVAHKHSIFSFTNLRIRFACRKKKTSDMSPVRV